MPKEMPVCSTCGSDDVVADAWAEWDVEKQEWVLRTHFDDKFCNDCEGSTHVKWISVNPTE